MVDGFFDELFGGENNFFEVPGVVAGDAFEFMAEIDMDILLELPGAVPVFIGYDLQDMTVGHDKIGAYPNAGACPVRVFMRGIDAARTADSRLDRIACRYPVIGIP